MLYFSHQVFKLLITKYRDFYTCSLFMNYWFSWHYTRIKIDLWALTSVKYKHTFTSISFFGKTGKDIIVWERLCSHLSSNSNGKDSYLLFIILSFCNILLLWRVVIISVFHPCVVKIITLFMLHVIQCLHNLRSQYYYQSNYELYRIAFYKSMSVYFYEISKFDEFFRTSTIYKISTIFIII